MNLWSAQRQTESSYAPAEPETSDGTEPPGCRLKSPVIEDLASRRSVSNPQFEAFRSRGGSLQAQLTRVANGVDSRQTRQHCENRGRSLHVELVQKPGLCQSPLRRELGPSDLHHPGWDELRRGALAPRLRSLDKRPSAETCSIQLGFWFDTVKISVPSGITARSDSRSFGVSRSTLFISLTRQAQPVSEYPEIGPSLVHNLGCGLFHRVDATRPRCQRNVTFA